MSPGYTSNIPMISPGCPIKSTYVLLISPLHTAQWQGMSTDHCYSDETEEARHVLGGKRGTRGWEQLGKCLRKSMKIIVSSIFPSTIGHTAIRISLNSWTKQYYLLKQIFWGETGVLVSMKNMECYRCFLNGLVHPHRKTTDDWRLKSKHPSPKQAISLLMQTSRYIMQYSC